jgi:hypothetical protein
MRSSRLLSALLVALALVVVVLGGFGVGVARAQDAAPSAEESVRRVRQLPIEEKRRLKEALERFRALAPEQREALRTKARTVGVDRLGELAGRDFDAVRRRHARLQAELEEILRLLGGPERLAALAPEERAYVRAEALRRFQAHCHQQLVERMTQSSPILGPLSDAERRARTRRGVDAVIDRLVEEKTPEEQTRFRALPPVEQRRERARLIAEWRMRQTPLFATKFDNNVLAKFIEAPREKRREIVGRHVRWFHLWSLLRADQVDRETLRMLGQLGADERAHIAMTYEEARATPAAARRARIVDRIRELYGTAAQTPGRAPPPRLRDILRERPRDGLPAPDPKPAQPVAEPR